MLAQSRSARALVPLPLALVLVAVAAALVVAACGTSIGTATSDAGATFPATATLGAGDGSLPATSDAPGSTTPGSTAPAGSGAGGSGGNGSGGPTDSAQPGESTPTAGATTPAPVPGTGPAAGCSGSDANRDFFAGAAAGVEWQVYCAVLPDTWFVQSGSYRLHDGGVLRIAYSSPSGARIELREGGTCVEDPGCVPSGAAGAAGAFGDRTGTFLALDGGGYAISVDGGQPVSWLIIGANLDETAFRSIAAALLPVATH